jgi:hypothetical protein
MKFLKKLYFLLLLFVISKNSSTIESIKKIIQKKVIEPISIFQLKKRLEDYYIKPVVTFIPFNDSKSSDRGESNEMKKLSLNTERDIFFIDGFELNFSKKPQKIISLLEKPEHEKRIIIINNIEALQYKQDIIEIIARKTPCVIFATTNKRDIIEKYFYTNHRFHLIAI